MVLGLYSAIACTHGDRQTAPILVQLPACAIIAPSAKKTGRDKRHFTLIEHYILLVCVFVEQGAMAKGQ